MPQFSSVFCQVERISRISGIYSEDKKHCTYRYQSVTGVPCMPEAVVGNGGNIDV